MLRAYFINIGLGTEDPFSFRFFPLEMGLFLLGTFSHQFIKPLFDSLSLLKNRYFTNLITFCFIGIILVFHIIDINSLLKAFALIVTFILFLPLLAQFQQRSELDNWIGSFSYPIYICHWIVIDVTRFLVEQGFLPGDGFLFYLVIVGATLCFAYLLESLLSKRVENLRALYRRG